MSVVEPSLLRLVLLLGLVAHKVLWEVLKRPGGRVAVAGPDRRSPLLVATKAVKLLVLGFLVVQTLCLEAWPILPESSLMRGAGLALFIGGLAMAIAARLQLGRNWADLEDYRVLPGQAVVARGFYRYVRHPIYTGDVVLLAGLELALNSWLVLFVIPVALVVLRQARAEEALLACRLPGYADYCRQTKRFIPFVV